jgi:hypothetical protein
MFSRLVANAADHLVHGLQNLENEFGHPFHVQVAFITAAAFTAVCIIIWVNLISSTNFYRFYSFESISYLSSLELVLTMET